MIKCDTCHFYRPLNAWGEWVMACFYTNDTGESLHGDEGACSGYKLKEAEDATKAKTHPGQKATGGR